MDTTTTAEAWKPFSYTHVLHPGGLQGSILALLSLAPVFFVVAQCSFLLSRRDLTTAVFLAGQLGNEVLNYVLKHTIKEPRPAWGAEHHAYAPKYGMPSNHSQFVAFSAAFLLLWLWRRWKVSTAVKVASSFTALAVAGAVAASRIALRYHTLSQVNVGLAVGAAVGCAWYLLLERYLSKLFPAIAQTSLAQALLVRDTWPCQSSVLQLEYQAVTAAVQAQRKAEAVGGGGAAVTRKQQ